ncbi:MAG: hypothetical protein ACRDBM_15390 [Sporomusa sp.]
MTKRGGARPGAGRPTKSPTEVLQRPQRGLRAFEEEWELISRFAKLAKSGRQAECEIFLKQMEDKFSR